MDALIAEAIPAAAPVEPGAVADVAMAVDVPETAQPEASKKRKAEGDTAGPSSTSKKAKPGESCGAFARMTY